MASVRWIAPVVHPKSHPVVEQIARYKLSTKWKVF
jgi:hypothetical protein